MSARRALWVSTSTESRGGVATYVRTMQATPLWDSWRIRHVATHRNGSVGARAVAFITGTGAFLRELVLRRPAVVHLHTASYGSFARKSFLAWVTRSAGIPVVIHVHGAAFEDFYSRSPRVLQRYIRRTLEGAGAVIALGQRWAGALGQIAPKARIAVVPNAVEPRTPVRQPGPGEAVRVLFLGEIEPRKGVLLLLDAWRRLADGSLPCNAELVIAGGGAVDQVRDRVKELAISDLVQVTGYVPPAQVDALLSSSHVLVLPSSFEGQPMAVLEAMAHGLCVVATDVGGVAELVGDSGILVPVDDVGALEHSLRDVLSDASDREERGAAAFRRLEEQFNPRRTWLLIDALYKELTS